MKETAQENLTMLGVLNAITYGSDLFNSIATDNYRDDTDPDSLKISRKQYYARLSKLLKTDLIERKNGRYKLTLFGKVIYGAQLGLGKAIDDHLILTATKTTKNTQTVVLIHGYN
jgi:hypothetical protein